MDNRSSWNLKNDYLEYIHLKLPDECKKGCCYSTEISEITIKLIKNENIFNDDNYVEIDAIKINLIIKTFKGNKSNINLILTNKTDIKALINIFSIIKG